MGVVQPSRLGLLLGTFMKVSHYDAFINLLTGEKHAIV